MDHVQSDCLVVADGFVSCSRVVCRICYRSGRGKVCVTGLGFFFSIYICDGSFLPDMEPGMEIDWMLLWFARRLSFPRPGPLRQGRNGPLTPRFCPRCIPTTRPQRWGYEICTSRVGDVMFPILSCDFWSIIGGHRGQHSYSKNNPNRVFSSITPINCHQCRPIRRATPRETSPLTTQ